ncbi:hypothetical protein EDD85DRAFT_794004 [Armillaria nabsnona]|nr:hypothetical protein EDD85DRAFT_794004 [Armillaria nabsnona]
MVFAGYSRQTLLFFSIPLTPAGFLPAGSTLWTLMKTLKLPEFNRMAIAALLVNQYQIGMHSKATTLPSRISILSLSTNKHAAAAYPLRTGISIVEVQDKIEGDIH